MELLTSLVYAFPKGCPPFGVHNTPVTGVSTAAGGQPPQAEARNYWFVSDLSPESFVCMRLQDEQAFFHKCAEFKVTVPECLLPLFARVRRGELQDTRFIVGRRGGAWAAVVNEPGDPPPTPGTPSARFHGEMM
eukprot:3802682-Rhodomonas_salina.1